MTSDSAINGTPRAAISVKAVCDHTPEKTDTRRFPLHSESSFEQLQKKLQELFGSASPFRVLWQDEQDDKISLTNNEELHYAINESNNSATMLRLSVSPMPTFWADEAFQKGGQAAYNHIMELPEAERESAFKHGHSLDNKPAPPTAAPPALAPKWDGDVLCDGHTAEGRAQYVLAHKENYPGVEAIEDAQRVVIGEFPEHFRAGMFDQPEFDDEEASKREWDDELAMLQTQGMPFDEAVARMRARADGESELPQLTAEQVLALSDDAIHDFARSMLDEGVPLDEAIAHAVSMAQEAEPQNEELKKKLGSAARLHASKTSAASENFHVVEAQGNLCFCDGTKGWAEWTIPARPDQASGMQYAELLVCYASGDARPLRMLLDGEFQAQVCLTSTTGFDISDAQWRTHSLCSPFDFTRDHKLRLEADDDAFFPHLVELALLPKPSLGPLDGDSEFNDLQASLAAADHPHVDSAAFVGAWRATEWSSDEFNAVDENSLLWTDQVAVFESGGGGGAYNAMEWNQDEDKLVWVTTPDEERIEFQIQDDGRLKVSFLYAEPGWIIYERDGDVVHARELQARVDAAMENCDGSDSGSDSGSEISDDEDAHARWSAREQCKREERREERRVAREKLAEKLAISGRWTKFLPHAADAPAPVLIDGTSIASMLLATHEASSERSAQMRVLDHLKKSLDITRLRFRVFFEGSGGKWSKKAAAKGIEIVFTAEQAVCDVMREQAAGTLVVTTNRGIALALLDAGARVMKADRFYTLTDTDSEDSSSSSSSSSGSSSSSSSESESEDDDKDTRRRHHHHQQRMGPAHRAGRGKGRR